jgi:hypothetical protein
MYRMYSISQRAMDGGAIMYRMYGHVYIMAQRARDGGAIMYRMYSISQRARDGGAIIQTDLYDKSAIVVDNISG